MTPPLVTVVLCEPGQCSRIPPACGTPAHPCSKQPCRQWRQTVLLLGFPVPQNAHSEDRAPGVQSRVDTWLGASAEVGKGAGPGLPGGVCSWLADVFRSHGVLHAHHSHAASQLWLLCTQDSWGAWAGLVRACVGRGAGRRGAGCFLGLSRRQCGPGHCQCLLWWQESTSAPWRRYSRGRARCLPLLGHQCDFPVLCLGRCLPGQPERPPS